MGRIQWQSEWSVGVPLVDQDHQTLVELINQVFDSIDGPEEYATLGSVLSALADYTDSHFQREERLMAECGYPNSDKHRAIHAELAASVRRISDHYGSDHGLRAAEVLPFLEHWLVEHILKEDMAYRASVTGNASAQTVAAGIGMTAQPFAWNQLRVLVLDDNANFVRLLSTILNGVGAATVETASTAAEAMALLQAQPFDIVLCDWQLTGQDGLTFVTAVRALPDQDKAGVPIIMVTGNGDEDVSRRAAAAGVNAYLEKPISARALLETLVKLVGR